MAIWAPRGTVTAEKQPCSAPMNADTSQSSSLIRTSWISSIRHISAGSIGSCAARFIFCRTRTAIRLASALNPRRKLNRWRHAGDCRY